MLDEVPVLPDDLHFEEAEFVRRVGITAQKKTAAKFIPPPSLNV
jgi:hypothetical protein